MNLCLGIDASAQEISAAVVGDGVLLAEATVASGQSGEVLVVLVRQVLEQCSKQLSDISNIAVGIGPGSFTGIRNGIATAQGLATQLSGEPSRTVFGVSSLLSLSVAPEATLETNSFTERDIRLISFPANTQENFCVAVRGSADQTLEVLSGALVVGVARVEEELALVRKSFLPEQEGSGEAHSVHFDAPANVPTLAARAAILAFRPPKVSGTANSDRSEEHFGTVESRAELFQQSEGGRTLRAVYAKPVHAKTLVERGLALTRIK